jgi:hypothetical protein
VASAWSSDSDGAPNGAQQAAAVVAGSAVGAVAIQHSSRIDERRCDGAICIDICQSTVW